MSLKSFLKRQALGWDIPDEYVCLPVNSLSFPLRVEASLDDKTVDISANNILLGYKPLLLGIYFDRNSDPAASLRKRGPLTLRFMSTHVPVPAPWVARLELKCIHEKALGGNSLFILEGNFGEHHFLSAIHQLINRIYESQQFKKAGNIGLPGNLYDQVRIAYAVTRMISIISLGDGSKFNLFPTDLHGPVGENFYAGSLRHEGNACKQVEQLKKIVISEVKVDAFRHVYGLGKNHMGDLKELNHFTVSDRRSAQWGLPLPESVVSYRELQWTGSFDAGIHRIHFYETVRKEILLNSEKLAHVHRYYAQWRNNQELNTRWFLR